QAGDVRAGASNQPALHDGRALARFAKRPCNVLAGFSASQNKILIMFHFRHEHFLPTVLLFFSHERLWPQQFSPSDRRLWETSMLCWRASSASMNSRFFLPNESVMRC